jgi:hypothetical protein
VTFDRELLERLGRTAEVRIETVAPNRTDGLTRRTIVWVVVDGRDVFVRSVRGERGRWYRDLLAEPAAAIHSRAPSAVLVRVRAEPVLDEATIDRASAAIRRKHEGQPGFEAMLRPEACAATLRLAPLAQER